MIDAWLRIGATLLVAGSLGGWVLLMMSDALQRRK